jgi:hypothetical protein
MRAWIAKNREKARAHTRASYRRHAEKRRAEKREAYHRDADVTKQRERANYVNNKAGGLVSLTCVWCEETFTATERGALNHRGHGRKFCSRSCKDVHQNHPE